MEVIVLIGGIVLISLVGLGLESIPKKGPQTNYNDLPEADKLNLKKDAAYWLCTFMGSAQTEENKWKVKEEKIAVDEFFKMRNKYGMQIDEIYQSLEEIRIVDGVWKQEYLDVYEPATKHMPKASWEEATKFADSKFAEYRVEKLDGKRVFNDSNCSRDQKIRKFDWIMSLIAGEEPDIQLISDITYCDKG